MRIAHAIALVPVFLAAMSRLAFCQILGGPDEPTVTEEETDARGARSTPPMVKTWYGGQILAADAGMVATFIVAAGASSTPLAAAGGISYFVTPAIIHGVHGRGGLSALSVALRIALPLIGMAMGSATTNCRASTDDSNKQEFCGFTEIIIGGALGVIAASAIDASLAWQYSPAVPQVVEPKRRSAATAHVDIAGSVVPMAGGAGLLLGGRF